VPPADWGDRQASDSSIHLNPSFEKESKLEEGIYQILLSSIINTVGQESPNLFVGGPDWLSDKIKRAGLTNII
jgi:hypothetical protein